MKKLASLLAMAFAGLLVASCGGEKPTPAPAKPADDYTYQIIRFEPDPKPTWVNDADWKIEGDPNDPNAVIYFKVESQRPTKEKADADIRSGKAVMLAGVIKQLTSVEMSRAMEGMLNDEGQMDTYFSEVSASISRNVDTSGVLPGPVYWEYVREKEGGEEAKKFYRVIQRFSMNYKTFKDRLMGVVAKEPRINEKLKNKAEDFTQKMRENLDKDPAQ